MPKNYINDAVVTSYVFGRPDHGHRYALQVTTAVTADGGLSGSTLEEAESWGKIQHGATRAFAWVEPTVSLPLLATAAIAEELYKGRSRLRMDWNGQILERLERVEVAELPLLVSPRETARSPIRPARDRLVTHPVSAPRERSTRRRTSPSASISRRRPADLSARNWWRRRKRWPDVRGAGSAATTTWSCTTTGSYPRADLVDPATRTRERVASTAASHAGAPRAGR